MCVRTSSGATGAPSPRRNVRTAGFVDVVCFVDGVAAGLCRVPEGTKSVGGASLAHYLERQGAPQLDQGASFSCASDPHSSCPSKRWSLRPKDGGQDPPAGTRAGAHMIHGTGKPRGIAGRGRGVLGATWARGSRRALWLI